MVCIKGLSGLMFSCKNIIIVNYTLNYLLKTFNVHTLLKIHLEFVEEIIWNDIKKRNDIFQYRENKHKQTGGFNYKTLAKGVKTACGSQKKWIK